VQLASGAAGLRVIQGAGQKGLPGSQLTSTAVVELFAADGLSAASTGQTVTFTASAGAAISPTSTTLDASGRASATMTVGPTAGTTYIYTATVGTFSVSWAGSASPGTPTHFVTNTSTTLDFAAGSVPSPFPTLRVADALENSVSGVILKITIKENGVTLANNPFQVPADSVGILELSTITSPLTKASTYTVLVEAADPALSVPPVTYNVTIRAAAPAKLVFTVQPSTVAANQPVTPAVKVEVRDQYDNVATTASGAISVAMDSVTSAGVSQVGTGSATVSAGVATFSNLRFSAAKNGVRIKAAGFSLAAVLSAAFNIIP
jgi:hypothetical protein